METFGLYRLERLLSELPVCSLHSQKNDKSAYGGRPLQSVRVEALILTVS